MAQKFKERLLQGTGVSNKKFESDYAMKLMQKMGWNQGQGLGKNKDGQTDCVQIERRADQLALGAQQYSLGQSWNDLWWEQSYSSSLKNLKPISTKNLPQPISSDEEDKFSDYEKHKINRSQKPKTYAQSVKVLIEQDSDSENDTFIAIQKKKIKKTK
ncbi:unnamed protein product [Paramecium primaurelia]|uniref:G-patch domain-containing protein n=2 Tax=Paramecium TaxID=5884 RepID=A0A8S1VGK3_9CILI|nr:unnamed protein product [Paramecium primaurelia]CAD8175593.1 unnamed protein product [Paramecium pentaurelia]